jgi:tetratricopeptide (TPR) repeat protein
VLREGLSVDDNNKDLHFQLGVVLEKQQQFDAAIRSFRRVLVLDPKHAESYNYIGYMYAEQGTNLTEAIQLIQQALALEPENGYFIDSLGWAYYQQGRYAEALRELKRAVRLAKEDPVLYEHLGDAYLKNNLVNEALEAWEKSLQVDPNAPTAPQVRNKIRETRENQLRVKGAPPKAEQK